MLKNKNTLALLIILTIPLVFFFEPIVFKKVLFWGTTSTQFFPWMEYAIQQILHGNLPLWNPYNGWGAPFLANYQSAIFYPPNWILIILFNSPNSRFVFWIHSFIDFAFTTGWSWFF
jgi:hypothetical protein